MILNRKRLIRVVYFSRNRIDKPLEQMYWDIDSILERSQANNSKVGVTGALLFNRGVFGQVLEGPMAAVEETFERIQTDHRHHDVTVLDVRPIDAVSFPDWSMGFVGTDRAASEIFSNVRLDRTFELGKLKVDEIICTLEGLAMRNELRRRAA